MVTIRDIAAQLNLSPATVSRALNNDSKINIKTRERVSALAAELGYAGMAGRRRQQSGEVIGILCPEIISNNYSSVVEALSRNLRQKGYFSVFMITNMDKEAEEELMAQLTRLNVAGIVYISYKDETAVELLNAFKKDNPRVPVIQIANFREFSEYDSLVISNQLAAKMIVDHLYELGHREIAVISDKMAVGRMDAICGHLAKKEIAPQKNWISVSDARFEEGGYLAAMELLKGRNRPTAVIATYDYLAVGAMKACYDIGVRVPEDISIAAIDDVASSKYTYKGLTTVSMPHMDIGRIAARILVDRIQNDKGQLAIQHVSLNPELVIRESTAEAADKKQEAGL